MKMPLRLGTRGSPLALTQARMVAAALAAAHGWRDGDITIVPIRTSGDRIQDRPLAEVGGKALWTKELDRALIAGEIDFAVHFDEGCRDDPPDRDRDRRHAAPRRRARPADRRGEPCHPAARGGDRHFVATPLGPAPARAAGTSRSHCFRGNVDTRLSRLNLGEADATLLAAAGLDRLGRPDIGAAISTNEMLPAPAQGAVGIETLAANAAVRDAIAAIDDAATSRCVHAERALLAALGADCRSPVAALATVAGDALRLRAEILSEDGAECVRGEATVHGDADAAALARDLLARAGPALRALFTG